MGITSDQPRRLELVIGKLRKASAKGPLSAAGKQPARHRPRQVTSGLVVTPRPELAGSLIT